MHSLTRVVSDEQVDYSRVSRSVSGLGDSADEYDVDYFTPQLDSRKFSHLRLDEQGSDISRPLPSVTIALETITPLEMIATLPSPTPSPSGSTDSFSIVIGMPLTTQSALATSQMMMTESPSALSLMPISLPIGVEDSLFFSFEAALGVRGGSGDGLSLGLAPTSSQAISESPASTWIPGSANPLLQLLAPHIMSMV